MRYNLQPQIGEEAGQAFIQAYVEMRKVGSSRGQVSAYPRQLESLIRLSEAHARMRLSTVVEVADVEEARRFVPLFFMFDYFKKTLIAPALFTYAIQRIKKP